MSVVLSLAWLSALDQRGGESACPAWPRGFLGAPLCSSVVDPATHPPGTTLAIETGDPGAALPEPARRGLTDSGA